MTRGIEARDGEEVLVDARPHPRRLFVPALLACSAGALAVGVRDVGQPDRWPLVLSAALSLLGSLWLAGRWAQWSAARLTVTTERVLSRGGVLGRRSWQVPLERIHDITFQQTLWERLLGTGDLIIETGGGREQVIADVARPFRVQNEIYAAMEESTVTSAARAMDRRDLTVPEQIERLDELRQRGVISDGEFDVKKRQLLDRM